MPLFGPTQLLGPRDRQALIESGAYTAEDFGGKTVPPPAPQGPNYKSGSSAAADQRAITGETPLQQRQRLTAVASGKTLVDHVHPGRRRAGRLRRAPNAEHTHSDPPHGFTLPLAHAVRALTARSHYSNA